MEAEPNSSADLSALAWVQDELRRSLEGAHKALKRVLRDAAAAAESDVAAVDPALLRGARVQLHQGVGALELVGQPGAAAVLRASEALVQRWVGKPEQLTPAHLASIERASFALLDYLAQQLAGKPVSALALFPSYRAVQEAAGAERIHPADLWVHEWQWRELPSDPSVAPCQADARSRTALESLLLDLLRKAEPIAAAARMSELCAALGAGALDPNVATLWKLASAVFEAQAGGWLGFDVYSKRVASRLLAQLRSLERGESSVPPLLARDLLFFCAQSAAPDAGLDGFDGRDRLDAAPFVPADSSTHASPAPRLAAVHAAYGLGGQPACDYTSSRLGHFDPAVVAQARKRVAAAKEAWSGAAASEMHRLTGLSEQFALVGESLRKLLPLGDEFAAELSQAVLQTQTSEAAPAPALAMEVATSLLYLEAVLEDGAFDDPEQAARVRRLAQRLAAVCQGGPPQPLEAWMEALYRRVADRQTLGSVVHELRASLAEAEAQIDKFFRDPSDASVLVPVPAQLTAMRGVLSVLGLDHASAVLLRMRDAVDALTTEGEPAPDAASDRFEWLANNLGALGFLIDMLSVQPQLAQTLFRFDAGSGALRPVMGRVEAAADEPRRAAPVAPPPKPRTAVVAPAPPLPAPSTPSTPSTPPALDLPLLSLDFGPEPSAVPAATPEPAPAVSIAPSVPNAPNVADADLRAVFLEEASEVLAEAEIAHDAWMAAPGDMALATRLRRAFHTLKGSARMVGLDDFGAAAWTCEQVCNRHLGDPRAELHSAAPALLEFVAWGLNHLAGWIDEIAAGQPVTHDSAAAEQAATRASAAVSQWDALGGAAGQGGRFGRADLDLDLNLGLELDLELDLDLDLDLAEGSDSAASLVRATDGASPAPSVLPPNLPDASELDFAALPEAPAAASGATQASTPAPDPGLELDLPAFAESGPSLSDDAALKLFDPALFAPVRLEPEPELINPFDRPSAAPVPRADVIEVHPADVPYDLIDFELDFGANAAATSEPAPEIAPPAPAPEFAFDASFATAPLRSDDEQVKHIGPLRIGLDLFNIYLNEADELSRRLGTELAEWAMELHRPIDEAAVAYAHSLAGSSATVGFADMSQLARRLEHALAHSLGVGHGTPVEAQLFSAVAEEIRRLLHQFAAGFLKEPAPDVLARLSAHEQSTAQRLDAAAAEAERPRAATPDTVSAALALGAAPQAEAVPDKPVDPADRIDQVHLEGLDGLAGMDEFDELDAVDAIDAELFGFFKEEADEVMAQLAAALRDWSKRNAEPGPPGACMRLLHTLKGGARLAGAMRLGEMAHRLEGRIEKLVIHPPIAAADIQALQAHGDALAQVLASLRAPDAPPAPFPAFGAAALPRIALVADSAAGTLGDADEVATAATGAPVGAAESASPATDFELDWTRFAPGATALVAPVERGAQSAVRVRAPVLDRLVNLAGEVSIARSRIESGVGQIKASLGDLTDNLERLRTQLRELEFHGERQMTSRLEANKASSQDFDPLEFDRFTRFQELTRMMAESVHDVATVQRALQRAVDGSEDELVLQSRMTRELQDDLLRTRMVEFEGLSERLYRVVRQAAKETAKSVRLDIVGGGVEIDRGVLDRMTPAFEHLLRNCVVHGIETPALRLAAGKDVSGVIVVTLTQEGNEVGVEFRDDGAGLDLERIRRKGVALGLLDVGQWSSDAELAQLIFTPGFSTTEVVTELAGRGVGLDVVRAEVDAIGGRIETSTVPGKGSAFKLVVPLTTAVTQVVMLRCGETRVAVPSTLVEAVQRVTPAQIDAACVSGSFAAPSTASATASTATTTANDPVLPFFCLGALLQLSPQPEASRARSRSVVVIRSAQQRIVLQVDEVVGNQEVVVKHLGPQLARLPGLAGITLLASGTVALIYNPVALATLHGAAARAATQAAVQAAAGGDSAHVLASAVPLARAALVMVVDDSITVRRVTQRLLEREGYRVVLAKDGIDAITWLADELPCVVLSDIEMPRMDGFDFVRNLRADARLRDLPVIMITSRIAEKHRAHAAELGVQHYLGKPYVEEDLLALVAQYAAQASSA